MSPAVSVQDPMGDSTREKQAFSTHFETLHLDDKTLQLAHDATIVPAARVTSPPNGALETLPRLHVEGEVARADTFADLRLIGTLGEGGMGLVRLANQVPLDREVAVKSLRNRHEVSGATALLKEAYVTGHLEHPNIVPIYTLGADEEGSPLIVMKRIEGVAWLDVIHDPQSHPDEIDLDWHLNILTQVCNALRFAHSRGIVHRDIKPENVMIGNFGEVYLLDWGIALSIQENGPLPWRGTAVGVAGTPAYMAPEMTDDTAEQIDERTDVYLLGATLHEVLTGNVRHAGESLFEVMLSAFQSHPREFDDDVPAELGVIANRACEWDPDARFQTVEAFRDALAEYIEHRESIALSNDADESLTRLEAQVSDYATADEMVVHDLFGECRFGFRQALRMWPENPTALAGWQNALVAMADFHIESENLQGAQALLGELKTPPDDLMERLDALQNRLASKEEEVVRLKEFASAMDLRIGTRSRSLLAVALGAMWTISAVVAHFRFQELSTNEERLDDHLDAILRSLFIAGIGVFLFRKRIFSNVANRRIIYVLIAALLSMSVLRAVVWTAQPDIVVAQSVEQVVYAFAIVTVGLLSDLRIVWLSLFFYAGAMLGLLFPDYQLLVIAGSDFLVFGGLAWIWSPSQMKKRVSI